MTLAWWYRWKHQWVKLQEAKLQAEFAPQRDALVKQNQSQLVNLQQQAEVLQSKSLDFERLRASLADQEVLLKDRKVAVEEANRELRTQLRLLEAKAAPDRVWVEAFSRGYETAWQTAWPIMAQGVQNLRALIEQKAIDDTLQRLDPILHIRNSQELLKKREEFILKQSQSHGEEQVKYTHYLTALDWMLDANGLHSHQSTA